MVNLQFIVISPENIKDRSFMMTMIPKLGSDTQYTPSKPPKKKYVTQNLAFFGLKCHIKD